MPSTPIAPGHPASFQQSQTADDDLRRLNKALNATPRALRRRLVHGAARVHPSSQLIEEEEGDVGTSQKHVRIISEEGIEEEVEGIEEEQDDSTPTLASEDDVDNASEQASQFDGQLTQPAQRVQPNILPNQLQSPLALRIKELNG